MPRHSKTITEEDRAKNRARYLKRKASIAEWYANNRDARVAYRKKYYKENANAVRAKAAQWHRDNKATAAARHIKYRYGITIEQKAEMLAAQGGRCAICKCDDPGSRNWHTDHCHKTGKVRGVLCYKCNSGLGSFRDSQENLAAAIAYLEGNQ